MPRAKTASPRKKARTDTSARDEDASWSGTVAALTPKGMKKAVEHLCRIDPRLAELIERIGPCALKLRHEHTIFYSLLRAIVYQQLAGAAAATILGRVNDLFRTPAELDEALTGNAARLPTPAEVLEASEERLRSAGLSRNKMLAIKDLAAKTLDGTVPAAEAIDAMSDQEIIERLCAVRGIGCWTAEMLLIFRLGRPDVLPLDDLGVRKGFQRLYRMRKPPTKQQMLRKAEKWRPWRSIASWYLWRAAEEKTPKLKQPK